MERVHSQPVHYAVEDPYIRIDSQMAPSVPRIFPHREWPLEPQEVFQENNFPPTISHRASPIPEPPSIELPNSQNFGIRHKPVPANLWRISFSGEDSTSRYDLPIHEFLRQVRMFQEAETLSDDELLRSMIYLLTGRARKWFANVRSRIFCWRQFEYEIRQEFLPDGYDYALMSELENTRQGRDQSIGAYLTDFESKCSAFARPLNEAHQVHIAKRNLLPEYALTMASHPIHTLRELREIGRRMEGAYLQRSSILRKSATPPQSRPSGNRRVVNVVEIGADTEYGEADLSESELEPEICYVRTSKPTSARRTPRRERPERPREPEPSSSMDPTGRLGYRCVRCKRDGHKRQDCTFPPEPDFCFRCGLMGVRAPVCPSCSENPRSEPKDEDQRIPN